jgi:hypothetical protein
VPRRRGARVGGRLCLGRDDLALARSRFDNDGAAPEVDGAIAEGEHLALAQPGEAGKADEVAIRLNGLGASRSTSIQSRKRISVRCLRGARTRKIVSSTTWPRSLALRRIILSVSSINSAERGAVRATS